MQDDDLRLLGIPRSRCIYKQLSLSSQLFERFPTLLEVKA